MGNCMNLVSLAPQKKTRILTLDGGDEDLRASTKVGKLISGPYQGYKLVHHAQPNLPLPPETKLRSGEVYYLLPDVAKSPDSQKMVDDNSCGGNKIKMVVTRQQLQMMLTTNTKGFRVLLKSPKGTRSRQPSSPYYGERLRFQKWKPSLATIPEV